MNGADYIIQKLIDAGVTDAFGIPGGVLLELLYGFDRFKSHIQFHLTNHEQDAGYAAIAYAQASHRVGVAYATRGPGFTNLLTPLTDAFFDSAPVLFITAHSKKFTNYEKRFVEEQEFDTIQMVEKVTKKAVRIESVNELVSVFDMLIDECTRNRPGPVFVDIKDSVFYEEVCILSKTLCKNRNLKNLSVRQLVYIKKLVDESKKPVCLVGNGIRQSNSKSDILKFIEIINIPVISSAIAIDNVSKSVNYFGFIGSHGNRIANYLLYESDLVIVLGNRLAFPEESKTFGFFKEKKVIRFEIDNKEIANGLSNGLIINTDLKVILPQLCNLKFENHNKWLSHSDKIKKIFDKYEFLPELKEFYSFFCKLPRNSVFISDVGNNEFLLLNAYRNLKLKNQLLYSKSFSALGNSLPKAIGAYYATKKSVVAFMGDQGALFNIQALEFISKKKIPVLIFIINNKMSGMIRDRELSQKRKKCIHATVDSGYTVPDFKKIAFAFNINYCKLTKFAFEKSKLPMIVEYDLSDDIKLQYLPKSAKPYAFVPIISNEDEEKLKKMEEYFDV